MSKHKRTKATDVSLKTRQAVLRRDNNRCILCGSHSMLTISHFISKAQSGLGVEENLTTLCITCHHNFDNTIKRDEIKLTIENYLKGKYPAWNKERLVYRKWN